MADIPIIDQEKCDGCGLCVTICTCGVLVLKNGVVTAIAKEKCQGCTNWCRQCEVVCPMGAINCPFDIVIEES